jgi:hypothetical protein
MAATIPYRLFIIYLSKGNGVLPKNRRKADDSYHDLLKYNKTYG